MPGAATIGFEGKAGEVALSLDVWRGFLHAMNIVVIFPKKENSTEQLNEHI